MVGRHFLNCLFSYFSSKSCLYSFVGTPKSEHKTLAFYALVALAFTLYVFGLKVHSVWPLQYSCLHCTFVGSLVLYLLSVTGRNLGLSLELLGLLEALSSGQLGGRISYQICFFETFPNFTKKRQSIKLHL